MAHHIYISGKVQAVYYRKWSVENATSLGLQGWVRNLKDGRVEAWLQGDLSKIEEMIQRFHQGPERAKVTSVETIIEEDDTSLTGFKKKATL